MEIIAVQPHNGSVIHGLIVNDSVSGQISRGSWSIHGRTLCGIRGIDSYGGGGLRWKIRSLLAMPFSEFENERKQGWDNRWYNTVCETCKRRAAKAVSS